MEKAAWAAAEAARAQRARALLSIVDVLMSVWRDQELGEVVEIDWISGEERREDRRKEGGMVLRGDAMGRKGKEKARRGGTGEGG